LTRAQLPKFEGGLNLLHEADDHAVTWLESTATAGSTREINNHAAARRCGGFAAVGPDGRRHRSIAARPTLSRSERRVNAGSVTFSADVGS